MTTSPGRWPHRLAQGATASLLLMALLACTAGGGGQATRLALTTEEPSACQAHDGLPDAACTPGAVDPSVTQENIADTICASGYTRTVRPPVSATTPIKRERMAAYGDDGPLSDYELDHLIPLEVGGAPLDVANLWPEPLAGPANAHDKDRAENLCRRQVCDGRMPLAEAQQQIATDWRTACR